MHEFTSRWWILVVRGALALLFGAFVLAAPGRALATLVVLFGAWALVDGAWSIVLSLARARSRHRWGAFLFEGILSMAVGVATFVVPWATAFGLYLFIAARAIGTGIAQIFAAIWLRRHIEGELLLALAGVCSIGFGVLLIALPAAGVLAVLSIIAAYAFVIGIALIALGFRLHSHEAPGIQAPRPV
jgi:uncharacterized membrane protein HdeD (DUF308 family)